MEQLIIITDPNKDPDDLLAFVIASYLQKKHLIDIKGIITTSGDFKARKRRALCTKGAFLSLGLDVPVGVGADYPYESIQREFYDKHIAAPYKFLVRFARHSKMKIEENGTKLLQRLLKEAPQKSLTLLIIAGMKDVADLIRQNPVLVNQKIKQVAIMGGVHLNEDGKIQADTDVHNNTMDIQSADEVYSFLGKEKIPATIIHRDAVYHARIPNNIYAHLKETNPLMGTYLYENQKRYINSIFQSIMNTELKGKTPEWFFEHFTDLPCDCIERDFEKIWPHVQYTFLYDPITLLTCVPEFNHLFEMHQKGPFVFKSASNRYQLLEEIYHLTYDALKQK